jgi:hypothetical protein
MTNAQAKKLAKQIFDGFDKRIYEATVGSNVPPRFIAGLMGNEAGKDRHGNIVESATRFEPGVYARLKDVRDGQRRSYQFITKQDIADANDEALHALCTSYGATQIMGYHVIKNLHCTIADLRNPYKHFFYTVKLLDLNGYPKNATEARMDKEMRQWNTGSEGGRTYHDNYVPDAKLVRAAYAELEASRQHRTLDERLTPDSAAVSATALTSLVSEQLEASNTSSDPLQQPPNNATNKEVTAEITPEGGVKMSSSEGTPAPKERIAIIKATPKKWYQGLGTKVTTLVTGNALFQWVWGQIETISALSVPPFVWYSVSAIVVVGGLIWIIHEVISSHQDKTIQAEVDKLLVEQNSTPENLAQLIPANQVDLYRAKGYKIITRGDGSTTPTPPVTEV